MLERSMEAVRVGETVRTPGGGELRLAELLAALSVATDLGMAQAPERALRTCLVATALGRACDLPLPQLRDVYYTALLLHLGCTASAHETTVLFGDDLRGRQQAQRTDERRLADQVALARTIGRDTGWRRPRHVARTLAAGPSGGRAILRSVCEVGSRLAARLHLGAGVAAGLHDSMEGWDGRGGPYGISADDIAVPARIAALAAQVVQFDDLGGPDAARDIVRSRSGGWFDPSLADRYLSLQSDLLPWLHDVDPWIEVLEVEPTPHRSVSSTGLDDLGAAFADMVDLKTPFTLGHSRGVAALAARAADELGLDAATVTSVRHAGLLHDLGRVAVPGSTWERPRPLRATEWEQVRLHPYQTERILRRSVVLEPLAELAGMHHERFDGSGYHRGARGAACPPAARLLAAADAFHAMTEPRPHRDAVSADRAARTLQAEAERGAWDVECVRAVVVAAGHEPVQRRGGWPAGLTDREVEVLRLVAQGASNRQIGETLVISRRTAEHHVQHVYSKIGVSTRASAALFAVEHGLLR